MSEFKKFKSIDNHFREKSIRDACANAPVYNTCKYVAQEKVDGANFQIKFEMAEDKASISISYGKRTSMLEPTTKFENYQGVVAQDYVQDLQENVCEYMYANSIMEMILFCELYGAGMHGRINYGPEKKLVFYDIVKDGEYLTVKEFYSLFDAWNSFEFTVPIVGAFDSIEEALEFEVENVITQVGVNEPENFWEGVVIKPYDVIAKTFKGDQYLFYIKKKTEKFGEKMKVKKKKRVQADLSPEFQVAQDTYAAYFTENRLLGIFSKYGKIEDQSEIGQYIRYMVEDTRADFFKDDMDVFNAVTNDKEKGKIFSIAGKIVSKMLMQYL